MHAPSKSLQLEVTQILKAAPPATSIDGLRTRLLVLAQVLSGGTVQQLADMTLAELLSLAHTRWKDAVKTIETWAEKLGLFASDKIYTPRTKRWLKSDVNTVSRISIWKLFAKTPGLIFESLRILATKLIKEINQTHQMKIPLPTTFVLGYAEFKDPTSPDARNAWAQWLQRKGSKVVPMTPGSKVVPMTNAPVHVPEPEGTGFFDPETGLKPSNRTKPWHSQDAQSSIDEDHYNYAPSGEGEGWS